MGLGSPGCEFGGGGFEALSDPVPGDGLGVFGGVFESGDELVVVFAGQGEADEFGLADKGVGCPLDAGTEGIRVGFYAGGDIFVLFFAWVFAGIGHEANKQSYFGCCLFEKPEFGGDLWAGGIVEGGDGPVVVGGMGYGVSGEECFEGGEGGIADLDGPEVYLLGEEGLAVGGEAELGVEFVDAWGGEAFSFAVGEADHTGGGDAAIAGDFGQRVVADGGEEGDEY